MNAQTFANEMDIHYRTALIWLRRGLVPGAEEVETPLGNYWKIPRTALTMVRPKPGPKPKDQDRRIFQIVLGVAKAAKIPVATKETIKSKLVSSYPGIKLEFSTTSDEPKITVDFELPINKGDANFVSSFIESQIGLKVSQILIQQGDAGQ